MNMYMEFVLLASVASIARTTDFSEEMYLFLPLLSKFKPPPACPPNELYKTCTANCSDCTRRGLCVLEKCISGCDCAPRFYRVTPGGPCEPVANCPKPECDENEIFRECGPICETCATMKCRVINCDHKCYCKEGFRRNEDGRCIPEAECPTRKRCTRNEEWAESGLADEFCFHGEDDTLSSKIQNVSQCYCKKEYKRNPLGYCISEILCSMMKCIGIEVYHNCIPKCNTTCRNYGNPNCTEDDVCYPGCFCPPGYVMNDFRSCIPIENCSLDIAQVKVMAPSETTEEGETTDTTPPPFGSTTDITERTEVGETTGTTPPPFGKTTYITESTEHNCTDDITQDYTKDSDEETSMTTQQDATFSGSQTSTSSVSEAVSKEKSHTEVKAVAYTDTKHENAASSTEIPKQEIPMDEDDFDNEEI